MYDVILLLESLQNIYIYIVFCVSPSNNYSFIFQVSEDVLKIPSQTQIVSAFPCGFINIIKGLLEDNSTKRRWNSSKL